MVHRSRFLKSMHTWESMCLLYHSAVPHPLVVVVEAARHIYGVVNSNDHMLCSWWWCNSFVPVFFCNIQMYEHCSARNIWECRKCQLGETSPSVYPAFYFSDSPPCSSSVFWLLKSLQSTFACAIEELITLLFIIKFISRLRSPEKQMDSKLRIKVTCKNNFDPSPNYYRL